MYIPYKNYCGPNYSLDRPIWCYQQIPDVYGYIQDKYWSVGFLQSYQPHRVFYIFWGIQSLYILGKGVFKFSKSLIKKIKENGQINQKQEIQKTDHTINDYQLEFFDMQKMHGLYLYTLIMFLIAALVAHIQSCTRFFSSNPFFYFSIAQNLIQQPKYTLFYLVLFNIGGILLFPNFLPWT